MTNAVRLLVFLLVLQMVVRAAHDDESGGRWRECRFGDLLVRVMPGPGEPLSIGSTTLLLYSVAYGEPDFLSGTVRPRDGTIEGVWMADMDGRPGVEIVVWQRSAGSGGYGTVDGFRWSDSTLEQLTMPGDMFTGYGGHDRYDVVDGRLLRSFPIYREGDPNAVPSGGMMTLVFDWGHMSWQASAGLPMVGQEPPSVVPAVAAELAYVSASTRRVCQLTGDTDRATHMPTLSRTGERFGVVATDLGSSFEHKGNLFFLFGDTWGQAGDRDAVAWTSSTDPEAILLEFYKGENGAWLPLTVPGITQGTFEVPSGGISIDGVIYVVCTTDHSTKRTMGRSVLARSDDDGRSFTRLYELSRDRFINVSFVLTDEWLYIYGSGEYRRSSVCLARVRPADIGERSKLEYFVGGGDTPLSRWSARETDATPLFAHNEIGEFSVAYLAPVGRYVMLYNAGNPRGIVLRSAVHPSGPWSDGTVIFDPDRDRGYGHFMHVSSKHIPAADALSDPHREEEWGGEYGPYIMSRFTTAAAGHFRIYYTMSTWNPYQVVVMQSDLMFELPPRDP